MRDRLTFAVEPGYPVTSLRLQGPLDLATATDVRSTLNKLLADQPAAIIVDLAGLVVVDDLAVLVFAGVARQAMVWPSCQIVLHGATAETRQALDRMALSRQMVICRDRQEALDRAAGSPVPPRLTERLPPIAEAARLARWLVTDACRRWGLSNVSDAAEIVVTELVGNAVRHAAPPIDLSLARRGRYLYIGVRDCSPEAARRLTVEEPAGYGRGLLVVDAFATAWGSAPNADGKVVWATLRAYPR
jgi:anti-anti-sigma regulatory factor